MRVVIGFHFFTEGADKLKSPGWTSAGFLGNAKGQFADSFQNMVWDADGLARLDAKETEALWSHFQVYAIGKRLLLLGHAVIRTHHRFAQEPDKTTGYHRRMQRLRRSFQATLEQGRQLHPVNAFRTRNQCIHLLKDEDLCWTFLKDSRIPLTNNLAESALRPYVIWRKLCFATQSLQGLRFRPMILTVTTTARQLGMSSLAVLRDISEQGLARKSITFRFPLEQRIA